MNTTKLKSFATEARKVITSGVLNRILTLGFDRNGNAQQEPVLVDGGAVFMSNTVSVDFYHKWEKLRDRLAQKGIREVMEEGAYTWFNRLMAIRIMQKNNLIDPVLQYRSEQMKLPVLLTNAMNGNIPSMPEEERRRLSELLLDPTRTTEQFAILITAFCHNTPVIDRCFGALEDYTELLLPGNILAEGGFIDMLNHTDFISDDDYKTPELIGWLYQFYISERKDEVFAKKGKYTPDEIPAATQIFTPNWIVKYMVQNTLGRIYLDNNPYEDELKAQWRYLVDNDNQGEKLVVTDLKDMKVADLACGSGHILNECFDLLLDLYVNEGYSRRDAIESIFANNLTGIDLDTRAKQLATFALLLKACQRDASFTDAHAMPHVLDMPHVNSYTWRDLGGHLLCALEVEDWKPEIVNPELNECFALMEHADSLGSIMKFDVSLETRDFIKTCIREQERQQKYVENFAELFHGFELILALTERYHAIVMNPPYMGSGAMGDVLSKYIKKNYEDGKSDLFSTFMILAIDRLADKGKYGMINMHSWMFLSSFEKLRKTVLNEQTIDSLLHLGPRTFDELNGEVVQNAAYVISKVFPSHATGNYFRLVDGKDCEGKERMFKDALTCHTDSVFFSDVRQSEFKEIPGSVIGYWASNAIINSFASEYSLASYGDFRHGMSTSDNNRFLRFWYEVAQNNLYLCCSSKEDTFEKKWYPYLKGGSFRKWNGNYFYVVNWKNDGEEIKEISNIKYPYLKGNLGFVLGGQMYFFKSGYTWSSLASGNLGVRKFGVGFIFDAKGQCYFTENSNIGDYILGILNSNVCRKYTDIISPTLDFNSGVISKIPLLGFDNLDYITSLVKRNSLISKSDWDAHETSWDFKGNELVDMTADKYIEIMHDYGDWIGAMVDLAPPQLESLEWRVGVFHTRWETMFERLHANEEELNRQFIDIYGLQDELTPDVPLDEVTILQQGEILIENNEIVWHDDVLIKQLISYAVGCWMGRYRLDKPGLHIAHTDATQDEIAPYDYNGEPFYIDDDGIIPLMPRDCMFSDNAAHRIADFVRHVFGAESQVANLNYMEATLGKSLEQYFIKDFWKDHKKMYQNRPIYWLFSSKKGAFQCLAYMHRMDKYTPDRIRQKYLLPHMDDLRKRIAELDERAATLNTQEKRTLESLQKQLKECSEYHERLHPIAEQLIDFDLDDGVVVNYAKFGDVLAKLK